MSVQTVEDFTASVSIKASPETRENLWEEIRPAMEAELKAACRDFIESTLADFKFWYGTGQMPERRRP